MLWNLIRTGLHQCRRCLDLSPDHTSYYTWYWSLKLHYNPRYKNLVVEQNSSCSARSCSDVSMAGVSSRLWEDLVDGTGQIWSSGFLCLANYVWIQWIQWIWLVCFYKEIIVHAYRLSIKNQMFFLVTSYLTYEINSRKTTTMRSWTIKKNAWRKPAITTNRVVVLAGFNYF